MPRLQPFQSLLIRESLGLWQIRVRHQHLRYSYLSACIFITADTARNVIFWRQYLCQPIRAALLRPWPPSINLTMRHNVLRRKTRAAVVHVVVAATEFLTDHAELSRPGDKTPTFQGNVQCFDGVSIGFPTAV